MIVRSCATESPLPTAVRGGTAGDTPPRPRSPWHLTHANWTKSCAPAATWSLTGCPGVVAGVGAVTVRVTVFVLPHPETTTSIAAASPNASAYRLRFTPRSLHSVAEAPAAAVSGSEPVDCACAEMLDGSRAAGR